MTDVPATLDDALEQVVAAARAHLAAVKAAEGAIDDERVWRSYVTLNNASYEYDQLLLDSYGEVTPWDTELIDLREVDGAARLLTPPDVAIGETAADPYPSVVSVRQRRDYRVPSVTALLAAAREAARRLALIDGGAGAAGDEAGDGTVAPGGGPESVAGAVLELVRDGDGSLGGLDVPELEPLAGVLTVSEVPQPLDPDRATATEELFRTGAQDRLLERLDEEPYPAVADDDVR